VEQKMFHKELSACPGPIKLPERDVLVQATRAFKPEEMCIAKPMAMGDILASSDLALFPS